MNALFVIDKDSKTELSEELKAKLCKNLIDKGYQIETIELGKNEVYLCLGLGCFQCFTKHPGECVNKDTVNQIRKNTQKYDLTIFLTPVLFGHFSSCIKTL